MIAFVVHPKTFHEFCDASNWLHTNDLRHPNILRRSPWHNLHLLNSRVYLLKSSLVWVFQDGRLLLVDIHNFPSGVIYPRMDPRINFDGPLKKAVFVPLLTLTGFPLRATDIAELKATSTTIIPNTQGELAQMSCTSS